MNYYQYKLFVILKNISKFINKLVSNLKENCDHTYPNGKSALHNEPYYETCKICGYYEYTQNIYESEC